MVKVPQGVCGLGVRPLRVATPLGGTPSPNLPAMAEQEFQKAWLAGSGPSLIRGQLGLDFAGENRAGQAGRDIQMRQNRSWAEVPEGLVWMWLFFANLELTSLLRS